MNVTVGEPAPDFTLPDAEGNDWTLSAHRGKPVVIYFYPKDNTPGCTTQACDVRDHWAEFTEVGAEVVGISPDDVDSHRGFARDHELPHTLLADPDRTVIEAYGAWGERSMYGRTYLGVIRSSVVVGPDGDVWAVFDTIQPKQQSAKALKVIRERAE